MVDWRFKEPHIMCILQNAKGPPDPPHGICAALIATHCTPGAAPEADIPVSDPSQPRPPSSVSHTRCESPSHWLNVQPFVRLQREDVNGDVLCVLLKHLAPPRMLVPAVLWLCACSAPFLRKAVSEVSGLGGECVRGVVRWKDWMGRTQS